MRESGCQRGSGGTSKLTWISPSSWASRVAIFVSRPRSRSTAGRRHRDGDRRRVAGLELDELVADDDGAAVPLVALLRPVPFRDEALGLAGLLQQRAALGEGLLGLGAALAGEGQGVPVPLEAGEPLLAGAEAGGDVGDRVLGDLEPARVLGAARAQALEGALELLLGPARAAVRAADRRLEPVAEGRLVALQAGQLVVAHGRRRAEEALRRHAGQLGEQLVGAGRDR